MAYNYPACFIRLKYYPVFLLSNKYGILVWGLSSKQMLHAQCENSITIVKDQAATSDNNMMRYHLAQYASNLTCRLIKI